jgi:hypothetical protein
MKPEIEPQAKSPSQFPGVAKVPRRKAKRKSKRDRGCGCSGSGGGRSAGGARGGKAPAGGSLGGSRDYSPTGAEAVEARAKIHAMLAWDDGFPVRPPAQTVERETYIAAWRREISRLGEYHSQPAKAQAILGAECSN